MVFNLNSTVLSFWAEKNTNREVARSITGALKSVNLLENAPAEYFNNADPATPRPDKSWLKIVSAFNEAESKTDYAKHLDQQGYVAAGPVPVNAKEFKKIYERSGGNVLKPGEALPVANAELFQSANPFWVILLTPLLVAVWSALRKRNREPTTPGKIGLGMIFASGCWLVMLAAVYNTHDGNDKASPFWLIMAYGVLTIGELCLSPIGLSMVTKLAPEKLGAVMMGGWFISIAIGNKLSGVIGGPVWKEVSHSYFFIGLTILMIMFSAIMFRLRHWLTRYIV